MGIALTPQASGLGDIDHLHRFGLRLALALKNQVIQRGHHNRRRALLFRNKKMDSTSLSWGAMWVAMSLNWGMQSKKGTKPPSCHLAQQH